MSDDIQSLPGEIWKPVVWTNGCYDVSSKGRVKRNHGMVNHRYKGALKVVPTRILAASRKPSGYLSVMLCVENKRVRRHVHSLVLGAFVGPRPEGMECCHNDGDPSNNELSNLRWDTPAANARDRHLHGTLLHGAACPIARLTDSEAATIRRAHASGGASILDLSKRFNVSTTSVRDVVRGNTYKTAGGPITPAGSILAMQRRSEAASVAGIESAKVRKQEAALRAKVKRRAAKHERHKARMRAKGE